MAGEIIQTIERFLWRDKEKKKKLAMGVARTFKFLIIQKQKV